MFLIMGIQYENIEEVLTAYGLTRHRVGFMLLLDTMSFEDALTTINERANRKRSGSLLWVDGVWLCDCGQVANIKTHSAGLVRKTCGNCNGVRRRTQQSTKGLTSAEVKAWSNFLRRNQDTTYNPSTYIESIGKQPSINHRYAYGKWRI